MNAATPSLIERIAAALEPRAEVLEAYLFGSQATGRVQAHSDIDVVVLNRATPLLYHRVLRDGVRVLSRDLRKTTTREGQALSRWCDYVPQLAKIEAARRLRHAGGEAGASS